MEYNRQFQQIIMNSKSVHSSANNKTKPQKIQRFSDFKINTESTSERPTVETSSSDDSGDSGDSSVSQFKTNDKIIEVIDYLYYGDIESDIHKKLSHLTFASIQYKQNLQKRISAFINTITIMIQSLSVKKSRRRSVIHDQVIPNCGKSKSKSKLTFQMIGSFIRKDEFLIQLGLQQNRLKQVRQNVTQMQQITSHMRGGFGQTEIIDLMNRVNRIQDYCQFLYKIVDQIEDTYFAQNVYL